MLVQVRAYTFRSSPDGPYPQGRPHEFLRNMWITLVMAQVSAATGIPPTRKRATATPSLAYFLSRLFKRKGVWQPSVGRRASAQLQVCGDCGLPYIGNACRVYRKMPTASRTYLRQLHDPPQREQNFGSNRR
jgi:hypothetical protein